MTSNHFWSLFQVFEKSTVITINCFRYAHANSSLILIFLVYFATTGLNIRQAFLQGNVSHI